MATLLVFLFLLGGCSQISVYFTYPGTTYILEENPEEIIISLIDSLPKGSKLYIAMYRHTRNWENLLLIKSQRIAKEYEKIFNNLWNDWAEEFKGCKRKESSKEI